MSGQETVGGAAMPSTIEQISGLTGAWTELVSQERAVAILQQAVAAAHRRDLVASSVADDAGREQSRPSHAMTHAWLITGPPGSGRSNAAKAFAAALQCDRGGCGKCNACRTTQAGAHPDVTLVRTEELSIGVDEVRDLVVRAAQYPMQGAFQVLVIEDADRITDRGADALLKSLEEPARDTVWILCAPTPDDVLVTIRSRCRQVNLQTPRAADVAQLLVTRDGVDPIMAGHAARAAQGHIGRARRLATDEQARNARHGWLQVPAQLNGVGSCLLAAERLVNEAGELAERQSAELNEREHAELAQALAVTGKDGKASRAKPRAAQTALKQLEDSQKARAKRLQRDALDRLLTELTTWYRDILAVQVGAVDPDDLHDAASGAGLINSEMRDQVAAAARRSTPDQTVRRIDALLGAREALESNVAPLLAMEALLLQLAEQ